MMRRVKGLLVPAFSHEGESDVEPIHIWESSDDLDAPSFRNSLRSFKSFTRVELPLKLAAIQKKKIDAEDLQELGTST